MTTAPATPPIPPEERGLLDRIHHWAVWWAKVMLKTKRMPEEAIKDRLHALLRRNGRMALGDIKDQFAQDVPDWDTLELAPGAVYVSTFEIVDGLEQLEREGCAVSDVVTQPGRPDRHYWSPTGKGRPAREVAASRAQADGIRGTPA